MMRRYAKRLLLGAIMSSVGLAASANCQKWAAPVELREGVEVQGYKKMRITSSDRISLRIYGPGGTAQYGDLVVPPRKPLLVRLFADDTGLKFLVLAKGTRAQLRLKDGTMITLRQGGELKFSSFDFQPNWPKQRCVRVNAREHLVKRELAEELGVAIIRRESDSRHIHYPPKGRDEYKPIGDYLFPELSGTTESPSRPSIKDALAKDDTKAGIIGDLAKLGERARSKIEPKPTQTISDLATEWNSVDVKEEKSHKSTESIISAAESVTPTKDRKDTSAHTKAIVCSADTGKQLVIDGLIPDADFLTAGVLKVGKNIPTYTQFDSSDIFIKEPALTDIPVDQTGVMRLISLPFGRRSVKVSAHEAIIPVRVLNTSFTNPKPTAKVIDANAVRFAVFSDAISISQAGFGGLENALHIAKPNAHWIVDWFEITASGDVLPPQQFSSFSDLLSSATGKSSFSPVTQSKLDLLVKNIEARMGEPGQPITRAFWVIEGVRLPNSTPDQIASFITSVTEFGNVLRGPSGKLRGWLDIIAGQFGTKFAEYYLEGAVKTTFGAALYVEDRKGDVNRTKMLTETTSIVSALTRAINVANRLGATKMIRAVETISTAGSEYPVYHRDDILLETGLLARNQNMIEKIISIDSSERSMTGILTGGEVAIKSSAIDMISLGSMRSGSNAVLDTRELSGATLQLRLKAFGVTKRGDVNHLRVGMWLSDLKNGFIRFENSECSHIFFPDIRFK